MSDTPLQSTSSPMISLAAWRILLLRLSVAVTLLIAVYGGCTLDPLLPECYRCPCGNTGLICEQGYCIEQQRKDTLLPTQLDEFIATCKNRPVNPIENPSENPPPPVDSGPIDNGPPVDKEDLCKNNICTGAFVCDPKDGSCIQKTQCPNNEPPLPDGTCPKKKTDLCTNVTCVPGKVCDPATGNCLATGDCRKDPTLCKAPQCCHSTQAICTSDCRQCNNCPSGKKCNQQSGACDDDTPNPTCQGTALCAHSGDCCNNNCVKGIVISDSVSSCECKTDKDCKSGKCSTVIFTQPTDIKLICSCNTDADCAPGGTCKSFLGTKLCAQ